MPDFKGSGIFLTEMKTTYLVFFVFLFSVNLANAQVGGIKSGSDKNTSTSKGGGDATKGGSNGTGCLGDACASGCGNGCLGFFIEDILVGGIKYHKEILQKKKDIPEVSSIELMPHFGYASPSSSLLLPRIRLNWGLFSTDCRFSNMIDFGTPGKIDYYNTLDWQILELNLVVTKPVIFRLGTGLMHEYYSSKTFVEHFIGFDLASSDRQFTGNAELRIAEDYSTGATPRLEGNLRYNYRIIQTNSLNGYATIGAVLQDYYGSTYVWTIQAGLLFSIH